MREVLFFNGLGLVEWPVANPAQEVGGWGGVAVPLARSLDLLLMTHQARVVLYLPMSYMPTFRIFIQIQN